MNTFSLQHCIPRSILRSWSAWSSKGAFFVFLFVVLALLSVRVAIAGNLAAQEYGDAVYRAFDFPGLGGYGHAGIYYGMNSTDTHYVIQFIDDHIRSYYTLSSFKTATTYWGAYDSTNLSSRPDTFSERQTIILYADELDTQDPGYTLFNCIDPISGWGTIMQPSEVDDIRCDGVVEYCYEYGTDFPVWGKNGTNYDISKYPSEHNTFYCVEQICNPDTGLAPMVQCGRAGGSSTYLTSNASIDYPDRTVTTTYYSNYTVVTMRASDQSGIHRIRYKWGSSGTEHSYRYAQHPTQDYQELTATTYSTSDLYYWVQDGAGNDDGYWHIYTINVNQPPNTPYNEDPTDGATGVSRTTDLDWSCSDPDGDTVYYTVYFEKNDSSPDNIIKNDSTGSSADPGTLDYDSHYHWKVKADDHKGGVTYSPVWDFTTATDSPPDTSITGGPSGTITYNDITFTFTGSDDVTPISNLVYSYKLDGYDSSWSSYTSSTSKSYNDLPNSSYEFNVRARDQAGNVDPSPASRSFTVVAGPATKQILSVSSGESAVHPRYSPDGTKISYGMYSSSEGFDIWVMNSDGSGVPQKIVDDVFPADWMNDYFILLSSSWSPDGRNIAYTKGEEGLESETIDIWTINSDGSGTPLQITTTGFSCMPSWSPDGKKIAYVRLDDVNYQIWVVNSDGTGTPEQIINIGDICGWPSWSPDGRKIAYTSFIRETGKTDLWVVNSDGTGEPSKIVSDVFLPSSIDDIVGLAVTCWSPDGAEICYVSDGGTEDNWEIWVTNSDGSGTPQPITSNVNDLPWGPSWRPDGTKIVYSINHNPGPGEYFNDLYMTDYFYGDDAFPVANIVSPILNQQISGIADVVGTVTDNISVDGTTNLSSLSSWTLEYGEGEDPESWTNIVTSSTPKFNELLASWDTSTLALGKYTLRLKATDGVHGNMQSVTVQIGSGAESDTVITGDITAEHTWHTVNLLSTYTNPIVITSPPTYHGADPGVVRVRNVTGSSFDIRFQEWLYKDGWHTQENIPYLVISGGRHQMANGSIWEAGTFSLSGTGTWTVHAFTDTFPSIPALFLTTQTFNGSDPITVRARNVTNTGFEAALFEEEDKMDGHTTEEVGYLAVYSPQLSGTVNINGTDVPYLLQAQSVDHRFVPVLSSDIKLEEEKSKDSEIGHINETISILALGDKIFTQDISSNGYDTIAIRRLAPEYGAAMEWGTVDGVDQNWMKVPLAKEYLNPVVVAKPVSSRGGDPGVIRIRNVSYNSFELRYNEWAYKDGWHTQERVFYMVVEAGERSVAGLTVEARRLNTSKLLADGWESITFSASFSQIPSVFTSVQTYNGADPVTTRLRNCTAAGFDLTMDEEEAKNDGHTTETIGWIAIKKGTGNTADNRSVVVLTSSTNHIPTQINFGQSMARRFPVVVSDMITTYGADPCFLRYQNLGPGSIDLFIQEEASLDTEMNHTIENVSLFVAE